MNKTKFSSTIKTKILLTILALVILVISIFPFSRLALDRGFKQVAYGLEREKFYLFGRWLSDESISELSVPFFRQKYSLSCEVASLRMALAFYGVNVSEDELISQLAFDTKEGPRKDPVSGQLIWGDPNKGFVGNINGSMPKTGYGVYEKPISDLALKYRNAQILEKADLTSLIEQIRLGHPIVVWGSLSRGKDISWRDQNGNTIHAISGEHARVMVGFSGDVGATPTHVILLDPVYGKIRMKTDDFLHNWGLIENKAVAIY